MTATFTYAARYQVEAVCQTPLRTGGSENREDELLRDRQGNAFLQGASLAGALRNWLEINAGPEAADALFGSTRQSGSLMVSDAKFAPDAQQQIRPRLRMDGQTGTAADGGKFDVAHMGAGSRLTFTLTWLGSKETAGQQADVERMLSALNSGEIRLGAQRSNGFGRLALTVRKRVYDMTDGADREAWLEEREDGVLFELPEWKNQNSVVFTLRGYADSVLVKASASEHSDGGSYTGNLREGGRSILPGTSVKGAVRVRVSAIAALLGLPEEYVTDLFGRASSGDDNGKAGAVRFEDVVLSEERRQKIARIRIDRLTGGVMRGGLFFEEPLSAPVTLRILAPADQPGGCTLLLYALRDLGLGLYNLGSGGAIGRGYITVGSITAQTPEGQMIELTFDAERKCVISDPDGLFAAWRGAWEDRV